MDLPKFAFFKGRVTSYADARIGLLTHTLNYGTGVFGGIRGYWNEEEQQLFVFRPADHFRRFLESASFLCMELSISHEDLSRAILEVLRAEDYRCDCYIRPLAYFSDEVIVSQLVELNPEISMVALPYRSSGQLREGLHLAVSPWRRTDDNMIPARGKIAGGYVNSFLAKTDSVRAGFDDALLLNADGHVAEASVTNFFLVRNGIACTPPVTDNVLEGITRRTILTLLREDLGVEVEERSIDRSELYLAEEAFLSGTAMQVAAITRIDHRAIGTGKVGRLTSSLTDLYDRVVRGRVQKYRNLCMPVYQAKEVAQLR